MICKRGDLILIPFPFADLSATKRRPVLALTDSDSYGDFLAVGLTSRPHHPSAIPVSPGDLVAGALPMASWVRTDRLITLSSALAIKSFGQTSTSFVQQVLDAVCKRAGQI